MRTTSGGGFQALGPVVCDSESSPRRSGIASPSSVLGWGRNAGALSSRPVAEVSLQLEDDVDVRGSQNDAHLFFFFWFFGGEGRAV